MASLFIQVIFGMILLIFGIMLVNKSIRFSGNTEKFEGYVVNIETIRGAKLEKFHYFIIEYFNGYNYSTYRSKIGRGFIFKKDGD